MADTPAGLIVYEATGSWSLWQRGAPAGEPLDLRQAGPPGTFWPNAGTDEVTFFDDKGGRVRLTHPLPGTPRARSVSFSPDRRYAAVDVDISEDLPPPSMIDIARGRVKYTPKPHRLALIECTTGKVAIADGEFDNFAYPPVWSHDSRWVTFLAPFQSRRLWACEVARGQLERINFGRRSPAAPLVNVTDLISD